MSKILIVDNYDSFVYTIADYLQQLGAEVDIVRNDQVEPDEAADYDGVLISPGPGAPADAGVSLDMIRYCSDAGKPLLGVCLGHQALAEAFGGTVAHSPELMHGKTSQIAHSGDGVFDSLPSPLEVTRYHSLAIEDGTVPEDLEVTASVLTANGEVIMAVQHRSLPLWGVQFHPESILTQGGHRMLANWLALTGDEEAVGASASLAPLINRG
ncbi:aminodeoxychorismate/anthranilate synthase component II [Flaviflexus salsibiostraticola]|uniref:Aminodeoxychorismate/anthranilate synthase component II n=1 Tax=Flaviflexus salsibiostraticola TaxID=1282737 RepID=A0A3S8ZA35_9ACTO|nr:gamma-glutamyl-gamma-aminobutyrate hydrolase family protein [Flaviflexus salsibiostraticola]AZN30335.1 aminodeoxychorismate/anthranilate synthase component II [Flaviflexus salsibiostraticola]